MFGFNSWVMDRLYPKLAERYPGMALRGRDDDEDDLVDLDDVQEEGVARDVVVAG
jgi:hypothetical protein